MAVSAQLTISPSSNKYLKVASDIAGAYTYDVVNMDYTITRTYDITTCAGSVPLGGLINVTIRAIREFTTPFHDWIKDNKKCEGHLTIYDSSVPLLSSLSSSGVNDGNIIDNATKRAANEAEKAMDKAWGESDDMFDDMDLKALKAYVNKRKTDIAKKIEEEIAKRKGKGEKGEEEKKGQYEVTVYKTDSADDLRNKIRTEEKKRNKDFPCKEVKGKKSGGEKTVDFLKNSGKSIAEKSTTGVIKHVMKAALESSRVIKFTDAQCVSLKEMFSASGDKSSWLIQIGILASDIMFMGVRSGIGNVTLGDGKGCQFKF